MGDPKWTHSVLTVMGFSVMMWVMNKKEQLLKQLHDVNFDMYEKCHDGVASGDVIGNDDMHFVQALRYVPNTVIKKWIKKCKEEVKKSA